MVKQLLFDNPNITALTISESWLNQDIGSELLYIDDYDLYRNHRKWGDLPNVIKKGGGVCTYIRKTV